MSQVSCIHQWYYPGPDTRANSSQTWKYARRDWCRGCNAARWVCTFEGCDKQSTAQTRSTLTLGNLQQHLKRSHGLDIKRTSSEASQETTLSLKQPRLQELREASVVRVTVSASEGKGNLLRYLIENNLAFNILDTQSWQELTKGRLNTWSSTTMKTFLLEESKRQRSEFRDKIRSSVPGVSLTVDEWTDRQSIPWMGIVINTVDLDFELKLHSPGMQFIDEATTAENLLKWLREQLSRMGLQTSDIASICTDNAFNISKAISMDPHLKRVQLFCTCHLINIAVKKATMEPSTVSLQSQDEEELLSIGIDNEEMEGVPKSHKHWTYEAVNDEDEADTELLVLPGKRSRVPSKLMQDLLQMQAEGSYWDCNPEDDQALSTSERAILESLHPAQMKSPTDTLDESCNKLIQLFTRCRDIAKYIKNHSSARRAFVQAQANVNKERGKIYKFQKLAYDLAMSEHVPGQDYVPVLPEEPTQLKALALDVVTRWNSLLLCVSRIIENSDVLEAMWNEHGNGDPIFTEHEWKILEVVAEYLAKYDAITNAIQGDWVIASEALLTVRALKQLIVLEDTDHIYIKIIKSTILGHLENHRAKLSRILSYELPGSLPSMCACIDPRAADLRYFQTKEARCEVRDKFLTYATTVVQQWEGRSQTNDCAIPHAHEDSHRVKRIKPTATASAFQPTTFNASHESSSEEGEELESKSSMRKILDDELRRFTLKAAGFSTFLMEHQVKNKRDESKAIFQFWQEKGSEFPNLKIVAATLLSVRITSASAERLFSTAGLIRTARRNKMQSSLFDALIAFSFNDDKLRQLQQLKREKRQGSH